VLALDRFLEVGNVVSVYPAVVLHRVLEGLGHGLGGLDHLVDLVLHDPVLLVDVVVVDQALGVGVLQHEHLLIQTLLFVAHLFTRLLVVLHELLQLPGQIGLFVSSCVQLVVFGLNHFALVDC